MKLLLVAFFLSLIALAGCNPPVQATGSSPGTPVITTASEIETDILEQVNKYRRSKGLAALKMNNDINTEARKHSSDMAAGRTAFGHDGFSARAKRLQGKITGFREMAENVAYGQLNAKEVVADWISSQGHKANIEGNYTQTGIGVVANKKGVLYYTQIFVK